MFKKRSLKEKKRKLEVKPDGGIRESEESKESAELFESTPKRSLALHKLPLNLASVPGAWMCQRLKS